MANPDPPSLRVLEIVRKWFDEDSAITTTGLDLRDYTNDLKTSDKPALFVCRGTAPAEFNRESDGGIAEPLAIDLIGYVEAPTEAVPEGESEPVPIVPPVTETRERFYQTILRRLYGSNGSGETLHARLEQDAATYGNGAADVRHVGPMDPLLDLGYEPPHGLLLVPCLAWLHYRDSTF